jgi:hypothetical protein
MRRGLIQVRELMRLDGFADEPATNAPRTIAAGEDIGS